MSSTLSIIDKRKIEVDLCLPLLVHHIPGRVRFRIYRLQDDSDYATNLKQFLLAQPQINQVRINTVAASIAITYRYRGSSTAEMTSYLTKLLQQATTTELVSSQPSEKPTSEIESWSSLTLPVFTTVVSWLSNQSGLLWFEIAGMPQRQSSMF